MQASNMQPHAQQQQSQLPQGIGALPSLNSKERFHAILQVFFLLAFGSLFSLAVACNFSQKSRFYSSKQPRVGQNYQSLSCSSGKPGIAGFQYVHHHFSSYLFQLF
jgi:hypothetical protein